MKRTIYAALLLASTALLSPASADLVLFGGNVHDSFGLVGGAGFGALPRVLTLQTSPQEDGKVAPGVGATVCTGDAICTGSNKSDTPTIGSAGWTTGGTVGIGFNADQTGQAGETLNSMTLSIYNGTAVVASYSLASAVTFINDELNREPGNGNAIFRFVLDTTQANAFTNNVATLSGFQNFTIGLAADLGCGGGAGYPVVVCSPNQNDKDVQNNVASILAADDGPDSFVTFQNVAGGPQCTNPPCNVTSVPGPVAGAGLPGLAAVLMFGLNFWRRRRNGGALAA